MSVELTKIERDALDSALSKIARMPTELRDKFIAEHSELQYFVAVDQPAPNAGEEERTVDKRSLARRCVELYFPGPREWLPSPPAAIISTWKKVKFTGDPPESLPASLWSASTTFLAIMVVGLFGDYVFNPASFPVLIGSLGASTTLLYSLPKGPAAQPRNFVLGTTI